jgi:serine/threonine-protein kinase
MTDVAERLRQALSDRYTLGREIGAGGMATVYLAHDVRHDRKVAVKVLKPELAAVLGAERFLNEIKVTANLQHPNILPLHDSGKADGFVYYVMPYVEGESLRAKLEREKELSIEETIEITKGVASALDYAHRQDVIHRDIKPENILLHDGQPLVADFGIALAVNAAGGTRLTETGLSLGTPQYMSPEQAMGDRELDGRSDIYSLACIMYEMLVGEAPYAGPTAQAILTKIVTEEATPVTRFRKSVPPNVAAAVGKALQKLPADRFEVAKAFAAALEDPRFRAAGPRPEPVSDNVRLWKRLAAAAAVMTAIALMTAVWAVTTTQPVARAPVLGATLLLPDTAPMAFVGEAWLGVGVRSLALSPDGTTLAYVAWDGEKSRLYLRRLAEYEVRSLPGTEGAYGPFFSPDGLWVGFFAANKLKKVRVAGGSPVELAEGVTAWGAVWSDDGHIYYASHEGARVIQLSEDGAYAREVARAGSELGVASGFYLPAAVPQSDFLLASRVDGTIWTVSLSTGEAKQIISGGTSPRYLASGHIVFGRQGTLMGVKFDRETGELTSDPFDILDGIRMEGAFGAMHVAFAETGLMAYAPGVYAGNGVLGWVDRAERFASLGFEPAPFLQLSLSPNGQHVAVQVPNDVVGTGSDIWWYDLTRREPRRLTTCGSTPTCLSAAFPAWLPDGESFAWTELFADSTVLLSRQLTRSAETTRLTASPFALFLFTSGWAQNGEVWAYTEASAEATYDLRAVTGAGDTMLLRGTTATEWGVTFSPDGDFVAYTSDETGDHEVWVEPFPPTGDRWQVSAGGGNEEAQWSPRGDELFYRGGLPWMRVPIESLDPFAFGSPEILFRGPYLNVPGLSYGVNPDASRFLVMRWSGGEFTNQLNVMTDWHSLIRSAEERAGLR